ncbi:MAG: phosphoglycerate mutase (2,3-diphosphoglycerate-independent), partial [Firmicutes bacterium]|nr:phosphoglycerate mutase (2,3-diphosphoglycerate-independent) [Bacillota bacterium]
MESAARIHKVLKEQYKRGAKDYWMDPLVNIKQEKPAGKIKNGDSLFFCCRRGDRQRQLLEAFVEPQFDGFQRDFFPDLSVVPLVQFHEKFSDLPTIFPPVNPEWTLGETLSRAQIRQTRIAESEKAGHVTFFFNGRRVDPFEGEDWVIVPSPHSSQFL